MTCSHCESNVVKALMSLMVQKIIANHNTDEVIIDSDNFDLSKIKSVLKELNYDFIGINELGLILNFILIVFHFFSYQL